MAEPPARFAGALRVLCAEAGLRQEKLAEAPRLSPRAIRDLKRVPTRHKDTVGCSLRRSSQAAAQRNCRPARHTRNRDNYEETQMEARLTVVPFCARWCQT